MLTKVVVIHIFNFSSKDINTRNGFNVALVGKLQDQPTVSWAQQGLQLVYIYLSGGIIGEHWNRNSFNIVHIISTLQIPRHRLLAIH
jgi:hypothetical protein